MERGVIVDDTPGSVPRPIAAVKQFQIRDGIGAGQLELRHVIAVGAGAFGYDNIAEMQVGQRAGAAKADNVLSIGIYSYELFHFYDVENIIRFGSAGALHPDLHLGDIVIAEGACTDSNYMAQFQLPGTYAPIADWKLLSTAAKLAEERSLKHMVGNVLSSDCFYSAHPERTDLWRPMGVLCVEMEISALYANAAYAGKRALGILSISDVIGKNEELSPEDRQTKFTNMMELALDTVTSL